MFYAELIKSIPKLSPNTPSYKRAKYAQAGSHNNVKIIGNGHYSGGAESRSAVGRALDS